jgi:hypothetical protein
MGMFNRLFNKVSARQDTLGLDMATAQSVVQDYRIFLETSAPLPGRVADERQLPHSKEHIKQAISVCISTIRDPGLNEHLKHGYLMLSAWQNDVGDENLGVDFTRLNLEADPIELAEQIQRESDVMRKWNPLIKAEQSVLLTELKALGVSTHTRQW